MRTYDSPMAAVFFWFALIASLAVNESSETPTGIISHPVSQTVQVGGAATFGVMVDASIGLAAYQWRKDATNIPGATLVTLTLTNVQFSDAASYRVVVSTELGSITSGAATLTVVPAPGPPIILSQPTSLILILRLGGTTVTFSVTALAATSYQWQKEGVDIPGATSSSLVLTNVQLSDAGSYTVVVSNEFGSVTSATATLFFAPGPPPPAITSSPVSQTVTVGGTATFSVTALAATTYQWQKAGVNIPGATSATLTLTNVQFRDAGSYTAVVSHSFSSNTSGRAALVVLPDPGSLKGDFNGDGVPDMLFQDGNGFLGAWLRQANLNIHAEAAFLLPSHIGDTDYEIVGTGDFNSDGREDVLFQHSDGTLAAWLMNGLTQSEAQLLTPSHPGDGNWRVVATGDVNLDGKTDLVFQHADGTLAVWHMDGLNLTAATLLNPNHPGDGNWKVAGVGDLNGDGMLDIFFQHTDSTLAVWFMNETTLMEASLIFPTSPGPGWRVAAVIDVNRDGRSDLIFQHLNLNLAVWFMTGTRLNGALWLSPRNSGGTWKAMTPK